MVGAILKCLDIDPVNLSLCILNSCFFGILESLIIRLMDVLSLTTSISQHPYFSFSEQYSL